jgi:hypothetical protein
MKRALMLLVFLFSIQTVFPQKTGIDSMLKKIAAEKDDNLRIDIIYSSTVLIGESNPLLGLTYAQRLLEYSQNGRDKIAEAYAMSYTGKMYGVSGNLEKGLEYALKGKEMAEETGNEKLLAISNALMGLTYKSLTNFPKTVNVYMAVIQLAEKANYPQAQIWAYQSLSEVYLATNQVDSALTYAQKDYELSQRIKYNDFIGYTLINLGAIHAKLGNTAIAPGYFDMAIQESYKSKSPKQLNWALTAKTKYFNGINHKDSAIIYAKKAIATVCNTAFESNIIKPAQLLLDIYRENNVDSAFKYSELYRITNDSLFNARAVLQTQLLTFEDELHQQKSAEQKIKADEQRKQNIQFALLALGIIIFIIAFLLLSRSFITNAKLISFFGVVALLIVFEFLNLLLHPFLERVTHHSPVLMLLALVSIAALLVPLHHKLEKWATTKLIEKNKKIRLAAAKKTIEQLEKNSNQTNEV